MITESIRNWQQPVYAPVARTVEAYRSIKKHRAEQLIDLREKYHEIDDTAEHNPAYLRRSIREDMELLMRKYHKYNIEERLKQPGNSKGAHYVEVGATETDFEHLIPMGIMRDMYLFGVINVDEILNPPTVLLGKENHQALKDAGWDRNTPDPWLPFQRYSQVLTVRIETVDGLPIDPETWTLADHYEYFHYLNN